jgi:molybdopterin-guanine dinucleotide biosynthesis protein A
MLALVLCGGESSRMGTDKGLLRQGGKSFARIAFDKLQSLGLDVAVSVNKSQEPGYSKIFARQILITDDESIAIKGPALGIISCHLRYPKEDLFVLACDLPHMNTGLLRLLAKQYYQFPGASVYLFANDGEREPLCAIYTAEALAAINAMIENGELTKYSMKFLLQQLTVNSIELSDQQKSFFRNFNNPADLDPEDIDPS